MPIFLEALMKKEVEKGKEEKSEDNGGGGEGSGDNGGSGGTHRPRVCNRWSGGG